HDLVVPDDRIADAADERALGWWFGHGSLCGKSRVDHEWLAPIARRRRPQRVLGARTRGACRRRVLAVRAGGACWRCVLEVRAGGACVRPAVRKGPFLPS